MLYTFSYVHHTEPVRKCLLSVPRLQRQQGQEEQRYKHSYPHNIYDTAT